MLEAGTTVGVAEVRGASQCGWVPMLEPTGLADG